MLSVTELRRPPCCHLISYPVRQSVRHSIKYFAIEPVGFSLSPAVSVTPLLSPAVSVTPLLSPAVSVTPLLSPAVSQLLTSRVPVSHLVNQSLR